MFEIDTHKRVMVEVLLDIYRDSLLRNLLGFKGGTMAYLFYELPRMSVDLDFDLIDVTKKEEVFEKLKQILSKYKVIEEVDKKNCLFFLVDYGFDQRKLKIEVSKRGTGEVFERKNYLGMAFLVMKKEAMVSGKMAAALNRKRLANRDIFDTWFFLKNNYGFDEDRLEELTGMKAEEVLKKLVKLVLGLKNNQMLFGLGDLLDNSKKDFVRSGRLKEELLTYLKMYNSPILR